MTGYKSSGYNLDKMELTWLWLDAQAERINRMNRMNRMNRKNRKETKNESKQPHLHPLTD